jgi:hypothetical protein
MNKQQKAQPNFKLGKEIAKKEQKKVVGGVSSSCSRRCRNSLMSCTTSPISYGYCLAVWPASGGVIDICWGNCSGSGVAY